MISLCMMCLELLVEKFVCLDLVLILMYIMGIRLCLRKQLKLSYFSSNFSNCRMAPFVLFEASTEAAANHEHELIEEKMNLWVEAIDALNTECRAFSHYYFNNDHSENFIKKRRER